MTIMGSGHDKKTKKEVDR